MKRLFGLFMFVAAATVVAGFVGSGVARADSCTTVNTSKGTLTAAVMDPAGTYSGTLSTGCDIGVYFNAAGAVDGANISGATHYGIFVDGAAVDVTDSQVSNIGHHPFNGGQNGVGIYYWNGASGTVSGNDVSDYEKGGITANGAGTTVSVTNNTVTGLGHVGFIAQNGIQFGFGATATALSGNTVSGNIYTEGASRPYVSSGILFYEAAVTPKVGAIARSNHVFDNQANITVVSG